MKYLTVRSVVIGIVMVTSMSCTTKKIMEDSNARFKDINEEFEKVVTVNTVPVVPAKSEDKTVSPKIKVGEIAVKPSARPTVKANLGASAKAKPSPTAKGGALPPSRRPIVDPFVVGEKVVLSVNYFNVEAGDLSFNVDPHRIVNGRKAYSFSIGVKSTKMFSLFYAVDNSAETFVDFEDMVPLTYSSESKETSRRKEVRAFFDWTKNEATYWEKTLKKNEEEKKKKIVWSIEPYTQNVISSLFYLRSYQLKPGEKYSFIVADNGKNYTFHAEILRREKLSTKVGELDTLVIKPTFELEDQFKPTGDNLFWVTDDDRKFIVRIESKIKIGTLVAKLKSIERGTR